jgi:FkbM family methyltransferase
MSPASLRDFAAFVFGSKPARSDGTRRAEMLLRLRSEVDAAIHRLRLGESTKDDFCTASEARIAVRPKKVEKMFRLARLHEPDFIVFARFTPQMGTIVDVGANWGHSVGSIRASGCVCPVLSIEVLSPFAPCLETVKRHLGKGFDYIIAGAGSSPGSLEFVTPVLNKHPLTQLTSARPDVFGHWTAVNVLKYAEGLSRLPPQFEFQFLRTSATVDRLDAHLARNDLEVPTSQVAAIKIDVEGFESDVLAGASATIVRDRPLLLLEGGNRIQEVADFLEGMGYLVAELEGNSLSMSEGYSREINGFFVHASRIGEYRQAGILN